MCNYGRLALLQGFLGSSDGKESACNAGGLGSIPGSGRSPGEGNGNPPQYSLCMTYIVIWQKYFVERQKSAQRCKKIFFLDLKDREKTHIELALVLQYDEGSEL